MKKFFLVLASLVFASSAFAQEKAEGPTFKYNVFAQSMMYTQTTAADTTSNATHLRVRPKFTASMGNVTAVTYFEIDQFAGDDDPSAKTTDGVFVQRGADNKGAVEIKNAYINVKDAIVPGLGLKSGIYGYKFPIAIDDDFFGAQISYNAGIAKITFDYIKLEESDIEEENVADTKTEDDAQIYSLKADIKLGDMTVTPAFLYQQYEEGASAEKTATAGALTFKMKQGPLGVLADVVYASGKNETTDKDIAGYAADLKVSYKVMPMLTVEVFGLYATGSDDTDETEFGAILGGENELEAGQLFMINDKGYFTHVVKNASEFDKTANSDGLMVAGFAVKGKVDKLKYVAQIGYAQCTSDKEGISDKGIGTEFDLRLGYMVAPKTELFGEMAYLAAGKYVEAKVSDETAPMYYGIGLRTSI